MVEPARTYRPDFCRSLFDREEGSINLRRERDGVVERQHGGLIEQHNLVITKLLKLPNKSGHLPRGEQLEGSWRLASQLE